MDEPRLPPVVAGRSALPAFLAVEAWADRRTAEAREAAERIRAEGHEEAARLRAEGEAALEQVVVEGEREAAREVASRHRDRVSEARRAVTAWIERAEDAAARAVDEAVAYLCGDSEPTSEG